MNKKSQTLTFFGLILLLNATVTSGQSEKYFQLWNDPEIQERIHNNIEMNRKGWFTLTIVDAEGMPVNNVEIIANQTRHEFLFGCIPFMLKGFPTPEENLKFEEYFNQLFNYASLPFYWKTLEPTPGNLRFQADSDPIYRRPAPDLALEFTQKHGITAKGHPLIWDTHGAFIPDWLTTNTDSMIYYFERRIRQIAKRYDNAIRIWDVINEATGRNYQFSMPYDYPYKTFKMAERYLSPASTFILNNHSGTWRKHAFHKEQSSAYLLAENLLLKGAKVDIIGFNTHFYNEEWWKNILTGEEMSPLYQLDFLDTYSRLGIPLHITEVTIPALPDNEAGERIQARLTEDYYSLWFSHPAVEAITWWNMVDNTAYADQNKWIQGFLREDFSPKPSYHVLNRLINEEWKTKETMKSETGQFKFKGFYGNYRLIIRYRGKEYIKQITTGKHTKNEFVIVLK